MVQYIQDIQCYNYNYNYNSGNCLDAVDWSILFSIYIMVGTALLHW
jgi:hypothetical protein